MYRPKSTEGRKGLVRDGDEEMERGDDGDWTEGVRAVSRLGALEDGFE